MRGSVGSAASVREERERADLVLLGQAVARLRLDRRRAVGEHRREPARDGRPQLGVRAGARRADGGVDAAALRGDRRVALAGEPAPDLGAAVAQPDGMRVRVDETRDDGAAGGVDRVVGRAVPEYSRA